MKTFTVEYNNKVNTILVWKGMNTAEFADALLYAMGLQMGQCKLVGFRNQNSKTAQLLTQRLL